ncbi:MAG TPA: ABC transporter ATP-binding protein [Clostridia bacterium]|nr:ABC transporter ATP-binding protein [Clostridia bacterium]
MPILEIKNLHKRFGGLEVFSDINIEVEEGQIYGIIGTNGSGKTTLFNIICGIYKPNFGQVIFKNQDITGMATWQISRLGIGRCFQTVAPFKSMTPMENVRVARATAGKFSKGKELFTLDEIITLTGLKDKEDVPTQELSLPDKKNVEIARALACNPELILFDEVSCGLSGEEIYNRMELMKTLAKSGITVIVVEHIMLFIKNICDKVAVLHAGKVIAEGSPEQVAQTESVIEAYLGGKKQ